MRFSNRLEDTEDQQHTHWYVQADLRPSIPLVKYSRCADYSNIWAVVDDDLAS